MKRQEKKKKERKRKEKFFFFAKRKTEGEGNNNPVGAVVEGWDGGRNNYRKKRCRHVSDS